MSDPDTPEGLSEGQQASYDTRQADQDRTLQAMHALEAALARAAPGREERWRDDVVHALSALGAVTAVEAENAEEPDSLLSDLIHTQPRLRTRVRGLRLEYRHLRDTLEALRDELAERPSVVDYADVRERIGWVLTGLRHQRARESDLIYEAYYEAFDTELSWESEPPSGPG